MHCFDLIRYLPGVFFRTKQIKGTPLLQLVEAYRNAEGSPRQRVVASLGNATLPAGDPRRLAKAVEDHINGQTELLVEPLSTEISAWVAEIANLAKRSKGATRDVSGTVIEGNDALEGDPALVNSDPEGEGWFFKLTLSDTSELDSLMDDVAYQAFVDGL